RHFETCAIRLHAARMCRKRGTCAADLLRIPRRAVHASDTSGARIRCTGPTFGSLSDCTASALCRTRRRHDQRRIPEGVPLVLLDHLRRDFPPEFLARPPRSSAPPPASHTTTSTSWSSTAVRPALALYSVRSHSSGANAGVG